jgi:hypothetical protein
MAVPSAAELFCSSSDWLDHWPDLLPLLRDLVLVPDRDGGIGAGCLREIADVLGLDREVRVHLDTPDEQHARGSGSSRRCPLKDST